LRVCRTVAALVTPSTPRISGEVGTGCQFCCWFVTTRGRGNDGIISVIIIGDSSSNSIRVPRHDVTWQPDDDDDDDELSSQ